MTNQRKDRKLETELQQLLEPHFPGIAATVAHSERWDRMCVTFRWDGFTDLLPEERFHRLINHIPEAFRESHLAGFVWLELTLGEDVDQFLRLPRSEDIAEREEPIFGALVRMKFFETVKERMKPNPAKSCKGDFSESDAVLSDLEAGTERRREARLLFIRYGAYCDCQAVGTVHAELAKKYPRAK